MQSTTKCRFVSATHHQSSPSPASRSSPIDDTQAGPMALSDDTLTLARAFSGLGVDEKSLITILGKSHPEERKSFRRATPQLFREDDRLFERWDESHVASLEREFLRIKNAIVLWTMHPWERDARSAREALMKGQQSFGALVEIACTRTSEQLLGARKAYHSLFDRSIEEDVVFYVHSVESKLLVALVSSYRYEGPRVNEVTAKSEAKILHDAIKDAGTKNPIEDEDVIRILSTRSKPHLEAISRHYLEISGHHIGEDLEADSILKQTVQCLCSPYAYFSNVLDVSLSHGANDNAKEALTRVIVTRADIDIKEIGEEYQKRNGVALSEMIEEKVNGNYKDFLLSLVARGD